MLELIWAPLLGAFSLLFDEYSDPRLLAICLAGFEAATCLAAQLRVTQLRDVFVNSLCNFTHLHTPRYVQQVGVWIRLHCAYPIHTLQQHMQCTKLLPQRNSYSLI
jgi:brefeldin A-inhibited guanine nucleotide-exchange protein